MITPKIVHSTLLSATFVISFGVSGTALAYGEKDAIRDCESGLSSEYNLDDFRHQTAKKIQGEGHRYEVTGETKIDGEKHPFKCQIEDRHVTSISYSGPEPERLGTAEKLAIGAAAAIAAGVAVSEMSKHDEDKASSSEATATQMKSCKNAVAEKFSKASIADISVSAKSGGKHDEELVAWTVELDGSKAKGTCTVSEGDRVLNIATTEPGGAVDADGELEHDRFYLK